MWWGDLLKSTCLQKPVERDPKEQNIGEEFEERKDAVNYPVRQPTFVIVFFVAFNGFNPTKISRIFAQ